MEMKVVSWGDVARSAPDLGRHVEERMGEPKVCYLATLRRDGWPRVHPVLVRFRDGRMVVTMYPNSPKGHDIRRNGRYAVHGMVEDPYGGRGEVLMTGTAVATDATPADIERGWVAFELLVGEVLATQYNSVGLEPVFMRWRPS